MVVQPCWLVLFWSSSPAILAANAVACFLASVALFRGVRAQHLVPGTPRQYPAIVGSGTVYGSIFMYSVCVCVCLSAGPQLVSANRGRGGGGRSGAGAAPFPLSEAA